jgi:hypothetical protein
MITLESGLFILAVIIALLHHARKTAIQRNKIKERINREYDQEIELSTDELKSRLGESELMYEDLEQSFWVHVGVLIAVATYFYWHFWYISLVIGPSIIFVGYKYLSLRPFTTGIADRSE